MHGARQHDRTAGAGCKCAHLLAAGELLHVAEALGGRHGGELDAVQEGLVRALQAEVRRAAHGVHTAHHIAPKRLSRLIM
jgi:hypothetical protein